MTGMRVIAHTNHPHGDLGYDRSTCKSYNHDIKSFSVGLPMDMWATTCAATAGRTESRGKPWTKTINLLLAERCQHFLVHPTQVSPTTVRR